MNKKVLLFSLIFLFFLKFDIYAQTIDRGPYLQSVTTASIFIKWRTDIATNSYVWYGSSPGSLTNTVSLGSSTTEHEVQITGLTANTKYYYAVGYNNGSDVQLAGADTDHYFNTTPPTSTTQTIKAWVLGNAGHKNADQRNVRDAFYNFIGSDHIDLMLLLGDNAYDNGTDNDYQLAWFENMYEDRLINSVMWSTFGNHDGDSADSELETGPYYDIFTFPTNGEAGGEPSGTEAYYSFDYGNIHFISLNTWDISRDVGDPMMDWLQDDLAGTSQDWIVAMFHHPPYNGTNGNDSDNHPIETDMREDFVPILEAAGVDLVLSSHHHSYQRSYLIKDHHDVSSTWDPATMGLDLGDGRLDGDNAYYKEVGGTGTVYMVAGSAGDLGSDPYGYPTMYAAIQELGSVYLEVTDLQLDVKFIDENDNIGDYFTIIKQQDPPTVSITNPTDGNYFASPQTVTIQANATDNIGNPSVEFFIDGSSIGTVSSPPYNQNWTIPSDGVYEIKAMATDGDGNVAMDMIKVRVGDGSECKKVMRGSDDAEEDESGNVNRTSGDLELINDGDNQVVGMRFEGLNIPQGAVITDAYIQFTSKNGNNQNPRRLDIYAEDSDNPSSFSTNDDDISNRTKTTAKVSWYPNDWTSGGQSGSDQKTLQIRSLIQEVVNRTGFSMDSPIVIIIDGVGQRVARSYEGNSSDAPELCIEFSNCTDSDGDGTCDADDICNGNPDPGDPCDDGDAGTYNDVIDANCNCVGTQYGCYPLPQEVGYPCDDGDAGTYDDKYDSNCDCVGTQYDCYPEPHDIGDDCDDGNAGTYDDMYNSSCVCEGIAYDCPSLQKDIGDTCDDGDANTINDEVKSDCTCAGVPNTTGTLTSAFVTLGSDDAEEDQSGNVNNNSSDLEMIVDGGDTQKIGLRFTNLNIPQGMYIHSAMIQFTADQTDNQNPCSLDIYGEDVDNSDTFTENDDDIGDRTKTTAKVTWTPNDWNSVNERGIDQKTFNIASVIQEIVNRPGYTSASAIGIIIEGTGKRTVDAFEGGVTKAPEIIVVYDASPPLPIDLLDVTAKAQDDGILVKWSTASETNNELFSVERSQNGRDFESIGSLPGKGTTTEVNNYALLDEKPERGINYYRIKQTDFDGKFSYSKIVSEEFGGSNQIQVYPSVVENLLTIQRNGDHLEESEIVIHDITGRTFKSTLIEEDKSEKEISLSELVPGVYFVSIYNNELVETFKIVKL